HTVAVVDHGGMAGGSVYLKTKAPEAGEFFFRKIARNVFCADLRRLVVPYVGMQQQPEGGGSLGPGDSVSAVEAESCCHSCCSTGSLPRAGGVLGGRQPPCVKKRRVDDYAATAAAGSAAAADSECGCHNDGQQRRRVRTVVRFTAVFESILDQITWTSATYEPVTRNNEARAKSMQPHVLAGRRAFNSYVPPRVAILAERAMAEGTVPRRLANPEQWWGEENVAGRQLHGWMWSVLRGLWCRGDDHLYRLLLKLLAHTIQRPDVPPRVGLVLYSAEQGSGKSKFFEYFGSDVIGRQFVKARGAPGKFNGGLATAQYLLFDDLRGSNEYRELSNEILSLIDQQRCKFEQKYECSWEANFYAFCVFLTNDKALVRHCIRNASDRRIFPLEVSDEMCPARGNPDAPAFWRTIMATRTQQCAIEIYAYLSLIPCGDLADLINRMEFTSPLKMEIISAPSDAIHMFCEWLQQSACSDTVRGGLLRLQLCSEEHLDSSDDWLPQQQ
ncbi:MAG: hypothetical protein GY842_07065, partial [bacterium]|nr:hypothetical protein [bacterium]